MKRRDFLSSTALASASLLVPGFLKALNAPYQPGRPRLAASGKRLVVLQLTGGNDGLNTVIPFADDAYYRARPQLGIPAASVLRLSDTHGLHPALTGLRPLFDAGQLSIVHAVGYPDPDRSHFRSMDIWHTASASSDYWTTGWLGRLLDAQPIGHAHQAIELDDTLSLALKGARRSGFGLSDPEKLARATQFGLQRELVPLAPAQVSAAMSELDFLYRTTADAFESTRLLADTARKGNATATYPQGELGRDLRTVAQLIAGGLDTPIYYVSFAGFDTHVGQPRRQEVLLREFGDAVAAFTDDLKRAQAFDSTVILVFSEFGRRVAENGSRGTDHGTAGPVMLISGALRQPGFVGTPASLTDLDAGDLRHRIDFRQIYATLLARQLSADPDALLGQHFDQLNLV
jgi:uncharacterized protein (DUF1501 family)